MVESVGCTCGFFASIFWASLGLLLVTFLGLILSVVFTLAILIVATCTYRKALASRKNYITEYSSVVSSYLAFWSVFPVLLLQASASNQIRRTNTQAIVHCLMVLFALANLILWLRINHQNRMGFLYEWDEMVRYDPDFQSWFNYWCLPSSVMAQFTSIIYALTIIGLVLMVHNTAMSWPESKLEKEMKLTGYSPAMTRILRHVRLPAFLKHRYDYLYAPIICISMWVFLSVFAYDRKRLLDNAGPSNKERELSFGKILSLTTWLPGLVDFGSIYFKGPRDALTGQLLKPYRAEAGDEDVQDQSRSGESNEQTAASYMEIRQDNL